MMMILVLILMISKCNIEIFEETMGIMINFLTKVDFLYLCVERYIFQTLTS